MNEGIDRKSPVSHHPINGNQACDQQKELKEKVDLLVSQEWLRLAIEQPNKQKKRYAAEHHKDARCKQNGELIKLPHGAE